MKRSDATAFVTAITSYKKLAKEKRKIIDSMTASTKEYFQDKTDEAVRLIIEVIDDSYSK
jgi:hypothetical protein